MGRDDRIPLTPVAQYQRQQRRQQSHCSALWALLDQVKDPEIPVISLWDLGILTDVQQQGKDVIVTITPTYSGCPAMDAVREDIITVLQANGFSSITITTQLSPSWTTDWISTLGREQLREFGIAPPAAGQRPCCPHCSSVQVTLVSHFGSTACKALYQCRDCGEPFDSVSYTHLTLPTKRIV